MILEYEIYAFDLSVRSAYLDTRRGFFNGPSVFISIPGKKDQPLTVTLEPPESSRYKSWKVATTLPSKVVDERGFGEYFARDYLALIDHPVELAEYQSLAFCVQDCMHQMAVTGKVSFDKERLVDDLERICNYQAELFGELPVSRYLFLTLALQEGYGGLEHRDSCSLICKK